MDNYERHDLIHLLSFISGRSTVFYAKKSDKELQEEYKRLTNGKER